MIRILEKGYDGYSMSNNARDAYAQGIMPKSKWTKQALVDALSEINPDVDFSKVSKEVLQKYFLLCSEWHHTSSMYNVTYFYKIDDYAAENITQEEIDNKLALIKSNKPSKPKRDKSNDDLIDEIYLKANVILASGVSKQKTEKGLITNILKSIAANGMTSLDDLYEKALSALSKKHANIKSDEIEEFVRRKYGGYKLNRNTNIFKLISSYISQMN